MVTLEELRARRAQILELAAQHGAGNVRIFGSVTRGEARPDSDVDFLIDVVDPSRFHWAGGGLLMDLQDLLDHPVDLVTERGLNQYLRDKVLREAVPL